MVYDDMGGGRWWLSWRVLALPGPPLTPHSQLKLEAVVGYSTLDRLHQIEAPTLVITGTEDRIISPHSSEVIASRIPNARLVKLEGGSHTFLVEMRGRFNREILDFLRGG